MIRSLKSAAVLLLKSARHRKTAEKRILIPAYAGLGNFIMMTPAILELKRRQPEAQVFLLTWPSYGTDEVFEAPVLDVFNPKEAATGPEGIVEGLFLLDPGASFSRKARFFLRLRQWRLSAAWVPFDACPPFYWWGIALAGVERVYAHDGSTLGWSKNWNTLVPDRSVAVRRFAHETDIHLDLLDLYCADNGLEVPAQREAPLYRTHAASASPETLARFGLRPQQYVVVQVSAANARFPSPKIWPRDRWAAVIKELERSGETVVLPGDSNERPLIDEFVREFGLGKTVNIAGQTTVREVSALIRGAKLLLAHDSGLMHIGNAHGTPLIALYGPTDWNFTMPKAPSSRILRKNLPCQPCMAGMAKDEMQARQDCRIGIRCMTDISAGEVIAAAREILGRKEPGN